MKRVTLILFASFLLGCNMENEKSDNSSMNQPSKSITELKEAVIIKGDTNAYYELSVAYLDYTFQEEFLIYAVIMANKYDYPQAYFDVFTCLTDVYLSDISKIDDETANLAIEYLLKAYNKNHHQAKDMVEEYSIMNNQNNIQQIERIFKE